MFRQKDITPDSKLYKLKTFNTSIMKNKIHTAITFSALLFILSITAARLNAQSFDIYVFDTKTGTSKAVTKIGNEGEWNASWSNNGKKIAHDVAGPGPQTIYVTDVTTGESLPLSGAEGGNDAAWSPDGNKIAFDIWENYYGWQTQNIYTVPSAGGARTMVRFNAHHASWNPTASKVAFDDNYGYIGTKDVNTGFETFVTYYGDRPAWSPNGQYIAFDGWWWIGGGIWIIKVDSSGNPQGLPKQITTSGYGPTWKNNSKELVYVDWPNGDPDLYSISIDGGTSTRVCGRAGGFDKGDYDPAYSNNGQFIAWSSFTDDNAASSITANKKGPAPNTGITSDNSIVLEQNYPNPFAGATKIDFKLPAASHVTVSVYNMMGQKIKSLTDAEYQAGHYSLNWNGNDETNKSLPAGMYLCELRSGNTILVKKMNLWK